MPAVDVGTGTVLTCTVSGFTGQLTGLRLPAIQRRPLPSSHFATVLAGAGLFGNQTFLPGRLSQAGTLEARLHFDARQHPPLSHAPELVRIAWPFPGPGTLTWEFQAFLVLFQVVDTFEDVVVAQATFRLSGAIITQQIEENTPWDLGPGPPTGGWSVRKLHASYTGMCLKVRRSSDNTELDIGFAGARIDTAALLAFVGSGDGHVVRWYDQGPFLPPRDLTAGGGLGPRIVGSGALILDMAGRPALLFGLTGTSGLSDLASLLSHITVSAGTIMVVWHAPDAPSAVFPGGNILRVSLLDAGLHLQTVGASRTLRWGNYDGGYDYAADTDYPYELDTTYVAAWHHGAGVMSGYVLGSTAVASVASGDSFFLDGPLGLGQGGAGKWTGYITECLTYNTALSPTDLTTVGGAMARAWGVSWAS